jgi:hypothetical protein
MARSLVFMVAALVIPACGGLEESQEQQDILPAVPAGPIAEEQAEQAALESREEGSTSEAQACITANERAICQGAVVLGAGLGCRAAIMACTGTTVVTVGGTAYPCAIVLAVACAALPASAAVYYSRFCAR